MENWGLVRKQPPDFSYYVNPYKDNEETKAAKKHWYQNTKLKEEYFDFNNDCVLYCKLDVKVLLMALIKFLAQSFPFQDLLVQRYGPSPSRKKDKMPYFHLFTQQTTIGSYRYVTITPFFYRRLSLFLASFPIFFFMGGG